MMKVTVPVAEEPTCIFNKCSHTPDEHNEGVCWHITQPDEKGFAQYCPCSLSGERHRLYSTVGYMEAGIHDTMITKNCVNCKEDLLLSVDESFCNRCKTTFK